MSWITSLFVAWYLEKLVLLPFLLRQLRYDATQERKIAVSSWDLIFDNKRHWDTRPQALIMSG